MKNVLRNKKQTNRKQMNLQEMRGLILRSLTQHQNKHQSRYFLKLVKVLLDWYDINNCVFHGVKKKILKDISWERSSSVNSYSS